MPSQVQPDLHQWYVKHFRRTVWRTGRNQLNTTKDELYAKRFKSFRYRGAKICNKLPTSVKNTEDVSEFIYRLNEWPGPVCKCGSCELCTFLTHELHFVIARWFYMPTWFYCLEDIYVYILYANDLHICICIYLYTSMCILLCLCTNRCICMYVFVNIDVSHSLLRLYIIISIFYETLDSYVLRCFRTLAGYMACC